MIYGATEPEYEAFKQFIENNGELAKDGSLI
jgi:hypothetical protein